MAGLEIMITAPNHNVHKDSRFYRWLESLFSIVQRTHTQIILPFLWMGDYLQGHTMAPLCVDQAHSGDKIIHPHIIYNGPYSRRSAHI